jgi:multicomponent Na+:H+ antiporter subunit B
LLAVALIGLVTVPGGNSPLSVIARHSMLIALPRWGTTEAVSEVVYGSRGFDTFGETFLLLAAVIGVTVLARGREPRAEYVGEEVAGYREQEESDPHSSDSDRTGTAGEGREEPREAESEEAGQDSAVPHDTDDEPLGTPAPDRAVAMTPVVRVTARMAAPMLLTAGTYLVAWGYTPGGGFPAGVVVVGVILAVYAGFGHPSVARVARPGLLEPIEMAGAAAIVAVGLLGLILKQSFLANWIPLPEIETIPAGGTMQLVSGAEFIEVATGLTIAVFALLGMRHEWTPDVEDADDEDEEIGEYNEPAAGQG